ncbi:MAG: hypothetical protein ACI9TB_000513 [Parasphingorhabdus sp.]|jgi:hypothetical protein
MTRLPFGDILVLRVPGIGDGFKEGFEAGRTAAVLGRGAMLALDISRIFGSGFAILDRFERDDILVRDTIVIRAEGKPQRIAVDEKHTCGLVIVREMFDDDYQNCSLPVLAAAQACETPTVLLE